MVDNNHGRFDEATLDLASKVAEEVGIKPEQLLDGLESNMRRVAQMRTSSSGKSRVLCIDKFSGEDWIQGEYDTPTEALRVARSLTAEAKPLATHHSVATVYLAYNPQGEYLGGDVWVGK